MAEVVTVRQIKSRVTVSKINRIVWVELTVQIVCNDTRWPWKKIHGTINLKQWTVQQQINYEWCRIKKNGLNTLKNKLNLLNVQIEQVQKRIWFKCGVDLYVNRKLVSQFRSSKRSFGHLLCWSCIWVTRPTAYATRNKKNCLFIIYI